MRWLALACGLFAAGVLGLYLLVAGHRADLSRMPDGAPAVATPAGPVSARAEAPEGEAAGAGDAALADAPPAAQAGAGAAPADPLAAAVERLRAGLPAVPPVAPPDGAPPDGAAQDGAAQDGAAQDGAAQDGAAQDAPGEATADAAPQDAQKAHGEPLAPGATARGDAGRPDNPAASSAEAARPPAAGIEPPVSPGRHVTAQGVRWALSVAGGRPSLVIPLDDGGEAHVQVTSGFLALNIHAMSRNVEAVRSLIQHDYLGRAGDYLFTPDGRLARL